MTPKTWRFAFLGFCWAVVGLVLLDYGLGAGRLTASFGLNLGLLVVFAVLGMLLSLFFWWKSSFAFEMDAFASLLMFGGVVASLWAGYVYDLPIRALEFIVRVARYLNIG